MTCRSQEDIWFPCQNPRLKEEVRILSSCWTAEEETRKKNHWESLGLIHAMQTGIAVNCSEEVAVIGEKNYKNKQPSMQPQAEISFFSPAKLCILLSPKACLFWKPYTAEKCLAKIQGANKAR